MITSNCPACQSEKKIKTFEKFGLQYLECLSCNTVYMSPHPTDEDIKDHFLNSNSSLYWKKNLSKITSAARRGKIYSPRLEWIIDMTEEFLPDAKTFADLSNRNEDYIIAFMESLYFKEKIIANHYVEFKNKIQNKENIQLIKNLNNIKKESIDVASAFEIIDYTADLNKLFNGIRNILIPGGLFFMTTISISGFDLQVLWGNSRSIFPLDRINVLSKKGLETLFERFNFEILEYSTPGLLDLDIVKNAVNKEKNISIPRFVKTLIKQDDEQLFRDFQEFLQKNRLSSFVRILVRKV